MKQRPAIVTFYSFKGGVGRTTLLASVAWQLASKGKRVVAIDLDVEAPGLGLLLGATGQRGLLDFLADHTATQSADLTDLLTPARQFGPEATLVDVVGAGRLDSDFFEKLARLDFVGSLVDAAEERPVRDALRALLKAIAARTPAPDYILLDSRAGLHDVSGLSLHDLAHVDVLVGRDSEQAYQGLELAIEALGRRRLPAELRCVVVQSMAPQDKGSTEHTESAERYRSRSHDAFVAHVYSKRDDDDPDRDAEDGAHFPRVCLFQSRLLDFSALRDRRQELFAEDYVAVADRIQELCVREDP
ncbi:MAG: AAA family ATPase [Sandaracinus sp.]